MKTLFLHAAVGALMMSTASTFGEEPAPSPVASPTTQASLPPAGLSALEHASKLVASINALDWKSVAAEVESNDHFVLMLKRDADRQKKNWPGIGAFRRADYNAERKTLVFRFAYGPDRSTPHEVWFHYNIDGDKFAFGRLMLLGW